MELTRRNFLRSTGAATLLLSLDRLTFSRAVGAAHAQRPPLPDYRTWEDVYRQKWVWDKVVRSTHWVNCWYQAHCAWNVYVKDGMVWREEQAADYPQIRPDVSDFNPRGCQKGACFSERMYDPTRVKYPLKRVGERGSGKWERISWEQALDEIADSMIDTIVKEGTDRVDLGPRAGHFARHADGGARPPARPARLHVPRHEHRDRRRTPRRGGNLRQDRLRALGRRLLLLRPDPVLGREPVVHPDPERALPAGGALQGRGARLHHARLQRLGDARRPLDPGEARRRRGARPRRRARAHRREALRPGLRAGADRPADAGARRHAPLPARLGPQGRRRRRPALSSRSQARRRARAGVAAWRSKASCPRSKAASRRRSPTARRSVCARSSSSCASTWRPTHPRRPRP